MGNRMLLLAQDASVKAPLLAWRDEWEAALGRVRAWGKARGATGFFGFGPFDKPSAFKFAGDPPAGWTKPKRDGRSRPKKTNLEAIEALEALPWPEPLDDFVERTFGLPTSIDARSADGWSGSRLLVTGPYAFSLAWPDLDRLVLIAPDYAAAEAGIRESHPDAVITWRPEGSRPEIPAGFQRLTEAEADLMWAQARVEAERRGEDPEP